MAKKKKAAKKKRKLTKKRTKTRKARRGSYDWEILKRRFFAREWRTIEEMCARLHIPPSTAYKACTGWIDERQQMDNEAAARVYELIVQDRVKLIRDMDARQYQMAVALQLKAGNQLIGKIRDKKTGQMVDGEFSSQAVALAAFRMGAALEQSLLLRRAAPTGDEPPAAPGTGALFTGPNLFMAGGSASPELKARIRELRDEDLVAILDATEPDEPGIKKIGGNGAPGKATGAG